MVQVFAQKAFWCIFSRLTLNLCRSTADTEGIFHSSPIEKHKQRAGECLQHVMFTALCN